MSYLKRESNTCWRLKNGAFAGPQQLDEFSLRAGDSKIARLNLHTDNESSLHVMFLRMAPFSSYPAHKHPGKDEVYVVTRGLLIVDFFSSEKSFEERYQIGQGQSILVRQGIYHSTSAGKNGCEFWEICKGPFDEKQSDLML